MKVAKVLSLLVVSFLLTNFAYAKDLKIAYVELGGVFNNYQKTKAYDDKLKAETEALQKQMEDMVKKFKDSEAKMALLKDDEKQKLMATLDKQKADIVDFQTQKRKEMTKKFEDMRQEIVREIEKIVSDIAKKDGYTFIFNDTVVLYGEKESNITEQVLKALNDSYSAKK